MVDTVCAPMPSKGMRVFTIICAFFACFSFSFEGRSFQEEAPGDAPVILVLNVARDSVGEKRERKFTVELQMALNEVRVEVESPSNDGFADLPLAEQISQVRTLLKEHNAVAVTWIYADNNGLLLLHLVAVSTGRALVRLVETALGQDSTATLALAARELLGTAFLFEPSESEDKGPIDRVVESVRETASVPVAADPVPWNLLLGFVSGSGIAGWTGPSFEIGGDLRLERPLVGGLFGRFGLAAAVGPFGISDSDEEEKILGWSIAPGISAGYRWNLGKWEIGPAIGVGANWSNLTVEIEDGSSHNFSNWRFIADFNLELRRHISEVVAVFLKAGLRVSPLRDNYRRESNQRVVVASPFLGWNAGLGVALYLGKSKKQL